MDTINIEILDINTTQETKGKNTWSVMTVTHKVAETGKLDAKKLMSFNTPPDAWTTLQKAQKGDFFSVEREKSEPNARGQSFWNWVAVHRQDSPPPQVSKPALPSPKSTYETPEERARRQVMIVRQSSISSAVELVKDHGKQPNPDEVIKIAKQFEAYVMGTGIADLTDDVIV